MNESSSDELRALLRSAEFARGTPGRPSEGSSDVPLDELAYLISSLDIDLGTPLRASVRNRASMPGGAALTGPGGIASSRPGQPPFTPVQNKDMNEVRSIESINILHLHLSLHRYCDIATAM